eukprot:scaffold8157_cov104-Cylindrotheca_fusiformis.AAC.1
MGPGRKGSGAGVRCKVQHRAMNRGLAPLAENLGTKLISGHLRNDNPIGTKDYLVLGLLTLPRPRGRIGWRYGAADRRSPVDLVDGDSFAYHAMLSIGRFRALIIVVLEHDFDFPYLAARELH